MSNVTSVTASVNISTRTYSVAATFTNTAQNAMEPVVLYFRNKNLRYNICA